MLTDVDLVHVCVFQTVSNSSIPTNITGEYWVVMGRGCRVM